MDWLAALAPLERLGSLQLNSCKALGAEATGLLCHLTSLTGLEAFRCFV